MGASERAAAGDGGDLLAARELDQAEISVDSADAAVEAVVLADELGDEAVRRPLVDAPA